MCIEIILYIVYIHVFWVNTLYRVFAPPRGPNMLAIWGKLGITVVVHPIFKRIYYHIIITKRDVMYL